MPRARLVREDEDEDSRALLGEKRNDTTYDRETSSDLTRSLEDKEDGNGSEESLAHTFEAEDYISHAQPRSRHAYVDRLRQWFRSRRKHEPSAPSMSHGNSSKFARTARMVFNYPEPGLELRGTAWLDGVRGLAAFEVFIFHYARDWVDREPAWGPEKTQFWDPAWYKAPFFRTFYNAGHAAVAVFFAISGYVLSYRMLQLYRQQRQDEAFSSLSSAMFRRAIRLYTPTFMWTFITMNLCWWLDPYLPKAQPYEIEPSYFGEVAVWAETSLNMLLPINYPDRWIALMNRYSGGVTWTISLEYYGSLVIFGALLLISRTRSHMIRLFLLLAMVVISFVKDDWPAAQFLLGMAYADWQLEQSGKPATSTGTQKAKWLGWLRSLYFYGLLVFGWFLAGLPGVHAKASENDNDHLIESRPFFDWLVKPVAYLGLYEDRQTDRYFYAIAGLCILIGVGETGAKRLMTNRFVQYLGKISFGLYLVHVPIRAWLAVLDPFYFSLLGLPYVPLEERQEGIRYFCVFVIRMIPALVVNFIAGGLFTRYLDQPSITLGKRFEQWCLSFGKKEESVSLPQYRNEPLAGVPVAGTSHELDIGASRLNEGECFTSGTRT